MSIEDYLELVDLTGHCISHDKLGFIDNANNNILTRLNISPENWPKLTTKFEDHFKNVVGSPDSISEYRQNQREIKSWRFNMAKYLEINLFKS